MRILSMVPSWTETLIISHANVVGRTRFCIHPREQVQFIPAVGGTKDWSIEKVRELKPDLIILDREENPKSMFDEAEFPCFVSHVSKIEDVAADLNRMSEVVNGETAKALQKLADRWQKVASHKIPALDYKKFPGLTSWIQEPESKPSTTVYVIWRKPWMAVSHNTFIGSMLEHIGLPKAELFSRPEKYFEFTLEEIPKDALMLFSTEPFPFEKKQNDLRELGYNSALVDGEKFSWFGIRALEFLEAIKAPV